MKQLVILALSSLLSFAASATEVPELGPQGDAAAGEAKAAVCAGCHGADGNSATGGFPKLAGQHAAYLATQLANFKSKERDNAMMYGFAVGLSDQDMLDLAAFYAAKKVAPGVAKAELAARGEQIYRFGDVERGVAACAACHGPQGKGIASANFPSLAGQWSEYTLAQLNTFKSGARQNAMMNGVAVNMRAADMEAVASYIEGLR
ncbi:c-type cytochrome [Litorivicinus lipolyticus]|uniref:C-type cytochrome n=1 Tax=Litorivicinus lipolyticus TaxID=418701 RepID=A0A5Q2QDT5_9GAMM|nr:c-type cytochrome [Litorivicinus lipolyticus]QGG79185.1 c-type cytochrome [Litorivicinus lipolyticus]